MKILVLCDQGNNRSVTLAHHLKYWDHDVIPAGLKTNSPETLAMLFDWADRIILTERTQGDEIEKLFPEWRTTENMVSALRKAQLWNIGPDVYPRPFNKELLPIVRRLMDEHKAEYKPAKV